MLVIIIFFNFICFIIVVMLGYQSLMLVSLLSVGIGGILVCSFNATALRGLFLGRLWFVLGSGVYSTPPLGRGTTRPPVPMATSLGAQSSGAPSGGGPDDVMTGSRWPTENSS